MDRYNVVWDSPSSDQSGSMPLGNGSTGLNAWIEPNGDLVFYISRTDSWGDNGRLLKVGRVRITMKPAPSTEDFLQTLSLADGTLKARCGEAEIRLWADANEAVIHAEIDGPDETEATAAIELWRTDQVSIPSSWECSDVNLFRPRPGEPWGKLGPTVMEPDNVLQNQEGRIGWYHRNIKSVGPAMHAKIQGVDGFERTDPLLHRTFGAIIKAENAKRLDDTHLLSPKSRNHRFDIYVHTEHPATEAEWLAATEQVVAGTEAIPFGKRRADHEAWWKAFWQRSWIHATPGAAKPTKKSLVPSNTLNFRFGADPNGGNQFSGQFGPSTILKRALRADDIRRLAKTRSDRSRTDSKDVLFSGTPDRYSEIKDSARWTEATSLTAELWIRPDSVAKSARLLDKTMPGSDDGFLLDTHPNNSLRLIVGAQQLNANGCLKAGEWQHVAAVLDGDTGHARLYLNGQEVAGPKDDKPESDASVVSRAYALQRYINACGGRGAYPIKFNGSIFTVEGFENGKSRGPDYRRWGPGYWWQNTRLPYISMLTSGDVEMTDPLYKMYCQDLFDYHQYRTRMHTGHGGIYVPECIYFWGEMFAETYGKTPFAEREDKLQDNRYHKWEWVSGLEMSYMMLDRYEHTLDEAFLKDTTIPFATEVLTFFVEHYDVDADGKLVMHPAQALETWWECTNPMDPVAGMHAVADRLLGLPEHLSSPELRRHWAQVKEKIPALPTREYKGETIFAPAEAFAMCKNGETPELYCVFPFRLSSFEKPNAEMGRRTLHHRVARGNQGWRQDEIFMAYLGLADEARNDLVGRARNHHAGSRFPAFWGPNFDWIPDQDHGGVLMKALQSMLLQTDGKEIYLLPAWPDDWNAAFKLHAPYRTIVEGRVENGKLVGLNVTPEARRRDVICRMNSAENLVPIDENTIKKWSAPFRGWHYYPDHVIPAKPNIKGFEGVVSTDVPTVFQLPGDKKWYMTFIGFDGRGYQSFVAESDDLLNWTHMRLAMGFGKKGEFDYGGCVLGAYLYGDYGIKAPRTLKKRDGKYWSLYGSYAKQGGYEIDPGYEGIASSEDGMTWKRAKDQYILSIHEPDVGEWEKDCIYQPWLVEHEGRFYNFYNAKKMPEWIEQIGLAASTDLMNWKRHPGNPILRVRPGGYDAKFCADGKVFRDGDHWVMFYFGVGRGGAHIMAAYSRDLIRWAADPEPLYKAGGNPSGLDKKHAHKISLVWNPENETYYMFYNAVGNRGRGIGLITSKPLATGNAAHGK